ncbi:MAG: NADH-quinone oxidoreductase subunit NuoE family protein, partial [Flavobacteriales bacterium]
MSDNLSELLGRKGVEGGFFDSLGKLATPDGAPSDAAMEKLAEDFLIGKANAYGTASFYDFLKPENKGKKVYVCNGTACVCAGTQEKVIETLQETFDADEIGHMTCLGRCHENSAFHYKGKNYSGTATESLKAILTSENKLNLDSYHVKANGNTILT